MNSVCFAKNFRGGFEEEIAGRPLITARALHHENRDHARAGIHGQIGAVGAVVAEHAVAQMIAQAVIDLGRAGLFLSGFFCRRAHGKQPGP